MIPATPIPTGAPTPDPTYQPTGAPTHPPSVGKLHTTDPDFILETLVCMARAVRSDGSNCANISESGSCLRRDATQSHPMCVPLPCSCVIAPSYDRLDASLSHPDATIEPNSGTTANQQRNIASWCPFLAPSRLSCIICAFHPQRHFHPLSVRALSMMLSQKNTTMKDPLICYECSNSDAIQFSSICTASRSQE